MATGLHDAWGDMMDVRQTAPRPTGWRLLVRYSGNGFKLFQCFTPGFQVAVCLVNVGRGNCLTV